MSGPRDAVVELLADLVEARSPSGEEGPAADVLCAFLREAGFEPERRGADVWCTRGTGERGLVLNSHLDTVPASDRWTRDPWTASVEGDRLFGLGSTDAKSCVAAMAVAFCRAADPGSRGRLVLAATTEEETGGASGADGLERILPELGPLAGGIVGEPTVLQICNGQRGLCRLFLHARGEAGHASRPWGGENAIETAAGDVVRLTELAEEFADDGTDPAVGRPTIQATEIEGGTAPNVIPDRCSVTLDVRTTPRLDNEEAVRRIREACAAELEVRSVRFRPVATPPDDPLVRAAREALPDAEVTPFGGVSDLYHLAAPPSPVPSVLIGPGDGRQSHTPDEFVRLPMVRRAVGAYTTIADAFRETGESTS